jgi:hypothetical protein
MKDAQDAAGALVELVRRVVRDVVREELVRERPAMLATRLVSIADHTAGDPPMVSKC